jgi:murein DD-endopeptidase MepM/ murein hydrolase activator NlpD
VQLRRIFWATLFALTASLLWTAPAESRPSGDANAKAKAGKSGSVSKRSKSPAPSASASSRTLRGGPPRGKSTRKRSAKRIIHQDDQNQVVLEWIQATRPQELYGPALPSSEDFGPFLPPSDVYFDFPKAPCASEDVVLEAHLHDENPDFPEAQASDESVTGEGEDEEATRTERLVAIARRLSTFLRPKSASARVTADDVDLSELLSANLRIPVEGVDAERLRDSFLDRRGRYRKHLAIDIGAPRGTPVLATADGEIVRMRREKRGGISIYQKDPTGKYLFFYCHLKGYAKGLVEGTRVQAGDTIGYVGSTGHVIGGPHLHFSITRVPEDDDFREGLAVNPYLLFLAGVP